MAATSSTPDEDLVLQVAHHHEAAMVEIYARYGGPVFALACRVLGDRQLAEDVAQEVFVSIWQNPWAFDPSRGKLRTVLMTRTHGKCVDVIRSRNARTDRETKVSDDRSRPDADGVDHELNAITEAELVRRAVDGLPVDERTVLQLAYFGANTYREVATILSMPEGTVKTRMRSALKRLRVELNDQFFGTAPKPSTRIEAES